APYFRSVHRDQMKHPRRMLDDRAWPASAKNRLGLADDFGRDKKIAERRMQRVGSRRREHNFGVARDLDRPASAGPIRNAEPPQFDIVLRRNDDLGMHVEFVISAPEFRASLREERLVVTRLFQCWLMGGRP